MGIETIGEAWSYGWSITMRCLDDGRHGLKHKRECGFRSELDMMTLVCTRGRDFPLARLAERLRCPRCGCRRMSVMFGPPSNRARA
jgi:hypothetical protein